MIQQVHPNLPLMAIGGQYGILSVTPQRPLRQSDDLTGKVLFKRHVQHEITSCYPLGMELSSGSTTRGCPDKLTHP